MWGRSCIFTGTAWPTRWNLPRWTVTRQQWRRWKPRKSAASVNGKSPTRGNCNGLDLPLFQNGALDESNGPLQEPQKHPASNIHTKENGGVGHLTPALSPFDPSAPVKHGEP